MAAAGLVGVTGLVLLTIGTAAAAGREAPARADAQAAADPAAPPGNNGTVKIHEGAGEPSPVTRNQPHVCTFHIHAAGFDAGQVLTFEVVSWPPTGSRDTVLTGEITADSTGEGRAPVEGAYSLPNGHYKLNVDTGNGTPTQDKHKVFWVECPPPSPTPSPSPTLSPTPSPTPSPSPTLSPTPSPTPSPSPTLSPSPSPSESGTESPSSPPPTTPPGVVVPPTPPTTSAAAAETSPPAQPGGGGLASTGMAALSPLSIAGACLLALGLVLTWLARRLPAGVHR
jgi:hypothetical protein